MDWGSGESSGQEEQVCRLSLNTEVLSETGWHVAVHVPSWFSEWLLIKSQDPSRKNWKGQIYAVCHFGFELRCCLPRGSNLQRDSIHFGDRRREIEDNSQYTARALEASVTR